MRSHQYQSQRQRDSALASSLLHSRARTPVFHAVIFTGATVVIFLASVLGARKRWPVASICNAAGATLGTAVLLLLVRERGLEYLNESFPALLGSPAWAKATGLMQTYGVGGMLLVSSMPIILHPVIAFGMLR